ncbi:MAG TPA: ATP-dependent Clp protease proteolytic subunit [Bacteroidales bacterium]|nr:ATP-dependent Clp protease proteolytic subunit [Bacteroidales bacterium]
MNKTLINQISGNSAEILMYGIIGKWCDIDVDYLVKDLEALKKSGVKNLTFFVNSDGGQVPQGQALWAYLNRSDFAITWVVDGVAASMMAMLLTNPKHTVIANKYSKFMYHRLAGGVNGNPDEVRAYADMMDKFEDDLIDMFAVRTGIDAKDAKKRYFNNIEVWLSAQEALELKLVNEIRDGYSGVSEPTNLTTSHDVYQHFSSQLTNYSNNNQIKTEMKKIATLLNLGEAATEDAIATAVQNLINGNSKHASDLATKDKEINDLKNKVAEHDKAKVKNLIDTAITAKKFGEDMRETYTTMATENFAMAEKVISNMSGVDPVFNQLGEKQVPDSMKNKTWDDLHKEGKLENLKVTNANLFAQLYKDKYGKEYKF